MSYDLRLGVKVEGAENCYAVVAEPEYSDPTYNIGEMLRKCMGWDFEQGEWYSAKEVVPLIEHGIHELRFNENAYKKYNAPNGWGSTTTAMKALESLLECIHRETSGDWSWNEIPLDCLYIRW